MPACLSRLSTAVYVRTPQLAPTDLQQEVSQQHQAEHTGLMLSEP